MSAQHTPGPWAVRSNDVAAFIKTKEQVGTTTYVATLDWWASGPPYAPVRAESLANARLIAAAPDLLAALQGILAITDRDHVAWDAARASIAKATGEAA